MEQGLQAFIQDEKVVEMPVQEAHSMGIPMESDTADTRGTRATLTDPGPQTRTHDEEARQCGHGTSAHWVLDGGGHTAAAAPAMRRRARSTPVSSMSTLRWT